ncbi:TIGR02206 family membrane protein [Candidatus Marinimicrobia bacterium]|nr:TIGR02206 family membrane protein [Candidatus Neomarinimicrobiota bacterium]
MRPYTFQVFSIEHIISIIVIIFVFIAFLRFNKVLGINDNSRTFLFVLAFIMISLDLSEDLVRVFTGFYSIRKDLPLQLCSIGVYLAAFTLVSRKKIFFDLIFYWGFVGATNAILTPDGNLFELRIFFFYSQAYHAALIFAVLWLMIKYDMRMRYGSILKVVISTNIIVGLLSILNYALDSNYMFLRQIPNSVSPFLMGEWPVYILMVQVFSIILVVSFIRIQDLLMKPIKY